MITATLTLIKQNNLVLTFKRHHQSLQWHLVVEGSLCILHCLADHGRRVHVPDSISDIRSFFFGTEIDRRRL